MLKGVSNISRGRLCCKFAGMIGDDETGKQYRLIAELLNWANNPGHAVNMHSAVSATLLSQMLYGNEWNR